MPSVDRCRERTQWESGGLGARGCVAKNAGWWWVTF